MRSATRRSSPFTAQLFSSAQAARAAHLRDCAQALRPAIKLDDRPGSPAREMRVELEQQGIPPAGHQDRARGRSARAHARLCGALRGRDGPPRLHATPSGDRGDPELGERDRSRSGYLPRGARSRAGLGANGWPIRARSGRASRISRSSASAPNASRERGGPDDTNHDLPRSQSPTESRSTRQPWARRDAEGLDDRSGAVDGDPGMGRAWQRGT